MNCAQVRAALPAFVYQDLPPQEVALLDEHLAICPACRAEEAALRQVGTLLSTLPPPMTRVDVARIYQEAGRREQLRLRRWRRVAIVGTAVAAVLLLVLGLRLELRVEAHQFVLRWGSPAMIPQQPPQKPAEPPTSLPSEISREDIQLVHQLIHALADDVTTRDHQDQKAIDLLAARVDLLEEQAKERWDTTERYVSALYSLNTRLARKE